MTEHEHNFQPTIGGGVRCICGVWAHDGPWGDDDREPVRSYPSATRATDPETSRAAEAALTRSGGRDTHTMLFLRAVVLHRGAIAEELGAKTSLGHWRAHKRLADLARLGFAVQGAAREAGTGHGQLTWWPTQAGVELAEKLEAKDA